MKFSATVATLFSATPLLAAPFSSHAIQAIHLPVVGRSVEAGATKTNPVKSVVSSWSTGASAGDGCLTLVEDGSLASNVADALKDKDLKNTFVNVLGDADFRAEIEGLLGDEDFLKDLSASLKKGDLTNQLSLLASNKDVLNGAVSLLGNADLMSKIGGDFDFGADFDFGGELAAFLQGDQLKTIVGTLFGQTEIGAKFLALLDDKQLLGKITVLLQNPEGFASGLAQLLGSASFITDIGAIFGANATVIGDIKGLFGADADFGAKLEALFGGSFSGIAKLLGSGNFETVLTGALGGKGFTSLLAKLFAGGEIFGKIGGLLKDSSFVTTLTGYISGFFSGKLDLQALVGKLSANFGFLTKICGLFDVKADGLQKFLSLFKIPEGGIFGFFSKVF